MLNLKTDFSAVGDGMTDDTTSVNNWVDAMRTTGEPGYVPTGTYKLTQRLLFGMPGDLGNSFIIEGEGAYKSRFDLSSAPTNQGPQVHFYTLNSLPTSTFPSLRNLGFISDTPLTLCALGLEDLSDNIGNANFTNVSFYNKNTTESYDANALLINHVFDSTFQNIVCENKVGYGNALYLRNSMFNTFIGGSYSNAHIGIKFADNQSWSNTFMSPDFENLNCGIHMHSGDANSNIIMNPYWDIWRPDLTPAAMGSGYAVHSDACGASGLKVYGGMVTVRSRTPLVNPWANQNVTVL